MKKSKGKIILAIFIILLGAFYASPNLYKEKPVVQISPIKDENKDFDNVSKTIDVLLSDTKIPHEVIEKDGKLFVFVENTEEQHKVQQILSEPLSASYNTALSSLPKIPSWLSSLGYKPVTKGLDLRGGVYLLLQVDTSELTQKLADSNLDTILDILEDEGISHVAIKNIENGGVSVTLDKEEDKAKLENKVVKQLPDLKIAPNTNPNIVRFEVPNSKISELKSRAVEQNTITLRERMNSIGVAEPSIQREGADRISVQLPGVNDPADAKASLSSTASLEYYLVDETATDPRKKKFGVKFIKDESGKPVGLKRKVIVTGANIVDASSGVSQGGQMAVNVVLDAEGAAKMGTATVENVGKRMAVVYIEQVPKQIVLSDGSKKTVVEKQEVVISDATIRGVFSKTFQTTGSFTQSEAQRLARTLRSGALVAPVYVIEERTVGPSAGKENIKKGLQAVLLGFLLVIVFMLFYYRRMGIVSVIALSVNMILMVAVLGLLGATLTLPGIAGVVLTLGMAVDANVLIFERIKEGRREGKAHRESIELGFDNAFSTIMDANITTLIAAVLLFAFGTGPIQGFAVTLIIGIATSMFTALVISRIILPIFDKPRQKQKLV